MSGRWTRSWLPILLVAALAGCGRAKTAATSQVANASGEPASQPRTGQGEAEPTRKTDGQGQAARAELEPRTAESGENPNRTPEGPEKELIEKPLGQQPIPTTAAKAIGMLDLRKFPQLNTERVLDSSATNLYYSAKASVAGSEAFVGGELRSRGWKPIKTQVPDSEQYFDRLYVKDGYYVRATFGASGDDGITGIGMMHLGNVDVALLPRTRDAEIRSDPNPIAVTYFTELSIADAARDCQQKLAQLGWQEYGEFHELPSVPHVKQFNVRRNATRIMVSVSRDPRIAQLDKTSVSYLSHFVLPFDIPANDDAQKLRLDTHRGRVEYETSQPVAKMVQFLDEQGSSLGWRNRSSETEANTAEVSETAASLLVEDEPQAGFVIQLARKDDVTHVTFQRASFPPAEATAEATTDAPRPRTTDVASKDQPPHETTPDDDPTKEFEEELKKELRDALRGQKRQVGSQLKKLGFDLQGIPLAEMLDGDDSDMDSDDADDRQEVREAPEKPVRKRLANTTETRFGKLATICKITYGGRTYELREALAVVNGDEPRPVIMFCEKPLSAKKAKDLLARGKEATLFELLPPGLSPPAIEIRLNESYASLSCFIDGASINLTSSDIQAEHELFEGRLRGRAELTKPSESFGKEFRFEATFDVELHQPSDEPGGAASAELTLDDDRDLPVPVGCESIEQESSKYRRTLAATIDAPLAKVVEFYQRELKSRPWKQDAASSKVAPSAATLSFRGDDGPLQVLLKARGEKTRIEVASRDERRARQDNVAPTAGKAKLVLANGSETEIEVIVGKSSKKLAAGEGAESVERAMKLDVAPGKHVVTIRHGGNKRTEEVEVSADTAWGVIVISRDQALVVQLY